MTLCLLVRAILCALLTSTVNLCLDYLNAVEGPERAFAQFKGANCMTDKLAALGALVGKDPEGCPERAEALQAFYDDAAGDFLVVNKWFGIQASCDLESSAAGPGATLSAVKDLVAHPDFTWTNPNRMRSVVSVFAGNMAAFHAADGSGYEFVGDVVLKVDKINNQIAARLAGSFSLWRKYDEVRQELMKAQLRRIKESEGVSKDVFEIAKKSLE